MKFILSVLVLFVTINVFSQKKEFYKTTVSTDSSIIETGYYAESLNFIRVSNRLNDGSKTYYTYYYYDTRNLKQEYIYDRNGYHTGFSKYYSKDGVLISTVDFKNGLWLYVDKDVYLSYELKNSMKLIGDSIIIEKYGEEFFKNNVIFDISDSYVFNDDKLNSWENKAEDWEDTVVSKPEYFYLCYNVKFSEDDIYGDLISIYLDSTGRITKRRFTESNKAYINDRFEVVADSLKGSFNLTHSKALIIAMNLGLEKNDTSKAFGILKWEKEESEDSISGYFRYYLTVQTKVEENIVPEGRSQRITRFDVYSFNPWNGELIEKKKMKSVHSWSEISGYNSGLILDND